MKEVNPYIPEDIKKQFDEIMEIKESRRTHEEIISDLAYLIKDYSKDSFLPYVMEMMTHIDQRNTSEAFKYLMSPMKQFVYLIDLYFSVEIGGEKKGMTEEQWLNITKLLNEIEMTYLGDIGFFNDKTDEDIDFKKISVSLQTFLDYFGNAQLSYEEQTLERFVRNCGAFESDVKRLFGFSVNDAVAFCAYIKDIINEKYTSCNYYFLHPDEWKKLTTKFIDRGVTNPADWLDESELALFKEYMTIPGSIFMHSKESLKKADLPVEIIENLISFLTYSEDNEKGTTLYYANKNPYFDTPLIDLNTDTYLCPPHKFLIESFYNRINANLADDLGERYKQFKNQMLEKKVSEIFHKLFGKDVQIFNSYYFDPNHTEQDILVCYKKFCFIVEVKDCLFRAPMRDPLKAFEKIKTDFKKSIQYGYEQCKRVEDEMAKNQPFNIYDHKSKKFLYEINPTRIDDYFSIVVTQFKYGGIQTNLENLLKKEKDALYPWSVCVDDLEAFVLVLKKLKKGLSANQFIEYLKYRESYHERLICSDELEMCGYFLNSSMKFKKYAYDDVIFATFAGMSDMFDAEYRNGLGFDNELDQDIKKHYSVPKYNKNYDARIISGNDLKNVEH